MQTTYERLLKAYTRLWNSSQVMFVFGIQALTGGNRWCLQIVKPSEENLFVILANMIKIDLTECCPQPNVENFIFNMLMLLCP